MTRNFADRLPAFAIHCEPMAVRSPQLLQFNASLADELGLPLDEQPAGYLARVFTGQEMLPGAYPVAQAYAGHQFGGFVPQLGDGRALLLGEVVDRDGRCRDIALKGSGPTPFSRGGDGKAAIGPVLREYLIGEAMHALGIPTTRALAAVSTGEPVMRMQPLPGAMLTRVAASHLRVGTFEYFAAQRRFDQVTQLVDFTIERHDRELATEEHRHLRLLQAVADRQAALMAQWMLVGFIHGVMNTDNMTISGETIDYGPCAFMEAYDPAAVFSSIDTQGRYAYRNQPQIARWNLARFAETLLPLLDPEEPQRAVDAAMEVIDGFVPRYEKRYLNGLRDKLGLRAEAKFDKEDRSLARDWLELLAAAEIDYTLAFRSLSDAAEGNSVTLERLFPAAEVVRPWLSRWKQRLTAQPPSNVPRHLRAVNPLYIPRNHLVEEALAAAADGGDLAPFERLLRIITQPFEERPDSEHYAQPAPHEFTACYRTFCGT
ncbi:MAG: YdiU family protein [Planctomycetota bacterium]